MAGTYGLCLGVVPQLDPDMIFKGSILGFGIDYSLDRIFLPLAFRIHESVGILTSLCDF